MQDLRGWGTLCGAGIPPPQEMIHISVIPPVGGLLSLEFLFDIYSSQCGPFACGCGSCVHTLFRFISMGNFPHIVSALLLCLWEEVSSGSSYITILNCLPSVFLSYCLYFCFYSLGFILHVMDQMTVVSYEFHPLPQIQIHQRFSKENSDDDSNLPGLLNIPTFMSCSFLVWSFKRFLI